MFLKTIRCYYLYFCYIKEACGFDRIYGDIYNLDKFRLKHL